MPADDEALRYYFDELTYLRAMGTEFARSHNMVASHLDMSGGFSGDPHVERLIESFAFLTGRIQRSLDREFPIFTTALLGILYPQLVQPVPPMAIARFDVDPARIKVPTGYVVEKNTPLIARSVNGLPCRFRTGYPVTLWPLRVEEAAIEPVRFFDFGEPHIGDSKVTSVLRLRLRCPAGGMKLKDLSMRRLRFFLNGTPHLTSQLYDLLFTSVAAIRLRVPSADGSPAPTIRLERSSLRQVGFRVADDVLPCPPNAHPGHRLIQEYFHFPDKFRFFDVKNLDRLQNLDLASESGEFEILLLLTGDPGRLRVTEDTFLLGCTPIVNLFPKTTEPIRLDHRRLEYRLVGDLRRERTTEIHSITAVSASSNSAEKTTRYNPFYSFRHAWGETASQAFWLERRVPTERTDLPGTDLYLSFLDLDFRPAQPADEIVYAHTLCTNRRLALELRDNAELQIESPAPVHSVICLARPTPPALPLLGGQTTWQLISNLSLNHLPLTSPDGLEAWREMLRIYSLNNTPSVRHQIDGITCADFRRVLRRFGPHPAGGFRTGNKVTLEFNPSMYTGSSAILFASVLRHLLALHTSINSFMQVEARRAGDEKGQVWKCWPALAGEQPVA
jgi:type VI secretion system protein ImpG